MLKTSNTKSVKPKKSIIGVDSNSKEVYYDRAELDDKDKIGSIEVDSDKVEDNDIAKIKNHQKLSKSKNRKRFSGFFISRTRLAFTKLRQVFVKALILHHFDPKCHIRIETNASGYTITRIFS